MLQGLFCDSAVWGATHLPNPATGNTTMSGRSAAVAPSAAACAPTAAAAAAAATPAAAGVVTAATAMAAVTATTVAIVTTHAVAAAAIFALVAIAVPSAAIFAAVMATPVAPTFLRHFYAIQTQQKRLCVESVNKQTTRLIHKKCLRNIIINPWAHLAR